MKCAWYVSAEQPECGKESVAKIKVRGKIAQATVNVCSEHKAAHDEQFARARTSRKKSA